MPSARSSISLPRISRSSRWSRGSKTNLLATTTKSIALLTAVYLAAILPISSFAAPLRAAFLPPLDRSDVYQLTENLARTLGFTADAISPIQMIDPNIFAPRRYQAAIYTGRERYLYQVRKPGDAVSALMHYLSDGGTLIVAGVCWPFYRPCRWDGHDFVPYAGPLPTYSGPRDTWLEKQMARLRQSPTGTFNRFLGLNIAGEGTEQFERPPDDDRLTVIVTDSGRRLFPSLPARVPFPSSGDLRFRPAFSRNLGPGIRYTSIATVVGESGKTYGDAICLIEHTSGRLAPGRVIYIWGTLIQGDLGRAIILDALRLCARRAGICADAEARRAARLAAQLTKLATQAAALHSLPERTYFTRQAMALADRARLAQAMADLGNARRAQSILADISSTAALLSRRVYSSQRL